MPDRKDALCAAAELVLAIENGSAPRAELAIPSPPSVSVKFFRSGEQHSQPRPADPRHPRHQSSRRDSVLQFDRERMAKSCPKRQVSIRPKLLNADAPADCAPEVRTAFSDSCRKHEFAFLEMVSRAYHDSLFIFAHRPDRHALHSLPHGYSHRPMKYAARKMSPGARWC